MNRDFVEMLSALSAAEADYIVVGAHALAAHGIVRATGDLDVWVRPTPKNAERVWAALEQFGAPLDNLTRDDLAATDLVFQIGIAPHRIDILTSITAVDFGDAFANHDTIEIEGMRVPVLSRSDLIRNKTAIGRPRDIADVAEMEKQ